MREGKKRRNEERQEGPYKGVGGTRELVVALVPERKQTMVPSKDSFKNIFPGAWAAGQYAYNHRPRRFQEYPHPEPGEPVVQYEPRQFAYGHRSRAQCSQLINCNWPTQVWICCFIICITFLGRNTTFSEVTKNRQDGRQTDITAESNGEQQWAEYRQQKQR